MPPASQREPPPEEIRTELEKILASETFARADRSRDFLRLVVSRNLAGEDSREILIGIEIYGSNYDPADGGLVRQLARGVRERLERYYKEAGSADPIRIYIPEGGYNPKYEITAVCLSAPQPRPAQLVLGWWRLGRRWVALTSLLLVSGLAGRWVVLRFVHRGKHLAVLPFEIVDSRPQSRQFQKGLLFYMAYRLSQYGLLTVERADDVLASGVMSSVKACRAFGADLVVSGSTESAEGKTRVTMTLSQCAPQRQLDSVMVESQIASSFTLEDLVAQKVTEMLRFKAGVNVLATAPGQPFEPQAEDFYLRARGYLLEGPGSVDNAIELFRSAVQADANFALAHAGLGEAYIRKYEASRDPEWINLARESCELATRINRNLGPVHIAQGRIYQMTGAHEMAVQEYQEAVRLEPDNADAYAGLAAAYEGLDRVKEAEETYKAAIQRRSGYWGAYNYLGIFYFNHGRYAESVRAFTSAARLAPDNFQVHRNLGGTYLARGRYLEAERELNTSLQLKPNAPAFNNLSALYSLKGEYQKAVEPMKRVVEMNPLNPLMAGNLARTYRYAGQTGQATAEYQRAIRLAQDQLEINPHQAVFRAELARMLAETGDTGGALNEIRTARAETRADMNVYIRAVFTYEMSHQRGSALEALLAIAKDTRGCLPMQIQRNPDLKSIRSAPEYRALASACKDN
jgi:tetratricopeptide (TPR) repeat protein